MSDATEALRFVGRDVARCQLLAALCLDHFGWFGDRVAVTPVRLVGALLLAAGAVLVLWPRLRA